MTEETQDDAEAHRNLGEINFRPVILSPDGGEVRGATAPVSGFTLDPAQIIDVYEIFPGTRRFCGSTVPITVFWGAYCSFPSSGRKTIVAHYRSNRIDSLPVTFDFFLEQPGDLPAPTFESPTLGEIVDQQVLLGGRGTNLATVRVYRDFGSDVLGTSVVGYVGTDPGPDPSWWRMTLWFAPGPVSLTATQSLLGKTSQRGTPLLLRIRPPALTAVTVTYLSNTRVKFSGSGYTGATVDIAVLSGPGGAPPPLVTVVGGRWETTVDNWTFGTYQLSATQKISDNAGGWIPSQEYRFEASSKLPPPTDVTHTVSDYTPCFSGKGVNGATVIVRDAGSNTEVAPPVQVVSQLWSTTAPMPWTPGSTRILHVVQKLGDAQSEPVEIVVSIEAIPLPTNVRYTVQNYTPVFSGNGLNGATVVLLNDGGGASASPDAIVANRQWTSRPANHWGPTLERNVHIRQGMNGQWSEAWVTLVVTIEPLPVEISAIEEDGLSPKISGTCYPGAGLILTFSDSNTEHRPDGGNGTWRFQRSNGFAPGREYTVTVIQSVAGMSSLPASRAFLVRPHKPVITEPNENDETHYDLTVRGTKGCNGATLQLRDAQYGRALGEPKLLRADGDWFIELKKLAFRKYQIDATQTIADKESLRSDIRNCFVVLLPPVIEVPAANQSLARTSMVSGTGEPNGQVSVWREGESLPLLDNVPVSGEGKWQAEVTLPVGTYTLKARQAFQDQASKDSPLRTYNVVPAAPLIESPGRGVHVGRSVVVSGFGYPGDTVTVTLSGGKNTLLGRSVVRDDRSWTLTLEADQPGGTHNLRAVAVRDGFESADSAAHPVVLGTYLPGIDEPAQGRWVENPLDLAGKGRVGVGRVTTWYNPEQPLRSDIAVTAQGWSAQATQALRHGGQWCRFQQSITDGADSSTLSDWVESGRFDISSLSAD